MPVEKVVGLAVTGVLVAFTWQYSWVMTRPFLKVFGFPNSAALDDSVTETIEHMEEHVNGGKDELRDTITLETASNSSERHLGQDYLIYMITGNPGLIEYYRDFLFELQNSLASSRQAAEFKIYGRSLSGFELNNVSHTTKPRFKPLDLPTQIDLIEEDLIRENGVRGQNLGNSHPRKVILIGHSVGSYIALEILSRHRARLQKAKMNQDLLQNDGAVKTQISMNEPDIVGAVCLFPTVVDIGLSESGRKMTPLGRISVLHHIGVTIARLIPALFPYRILRSIVARTTRFPSFATKVTTKFLKSSHGIHSALHLGRSEMQIITADRWSDEIWGAAHESFTGKKRAKLFFLFGEKDHWVADATRDELMKLRGRADSVDMPDAAKWKPWMEVDRSDIPHGFCIEHWKPVARRCCDFINEIVTLGD